MSIDLRASTASSVTTLLGLAALLPFTQVASGAVARTQQDKLREVPKTPEDFGAVAGDDINDVDLAAANTAAFQRLSEYVNTVGGGVAITIPGKTYVVGAQTFAGAPGKGYSYRGADVLFIHDCTKPVVINSEGARFRLVNGLRYGSFDPTTGAPNAPAMPNWNPDNSADCGTMLRFENNAGGISIRGAVELDGNLAGLIIGGQFGDTGRQNRANGIRELKNSSFYAENVYAHHHALDGIACVYPGAVNGGPMTPRTFVNCKSEYNGRQGMSWVGGIGMTAINCKFNRTGKAVNSGTGTMLYSAPGSGLDIEAEGSVCRRGLFINCDLINNTNTAMVASVGDSADVRFIGCTFGGNIWPDMPGFKFEQCKFHGNIMHLYGHSDPAKASSFDDCVFTDAPAEDYEVGVSLASVMFNPLISAPVYLNRCTINATRQRPGRLDYFVMSDCSINMSFPGTAAIANLSYAVYLSNAVLRNVTIDANITQNAPAGYYIETAGLRGNFGRNVLTNTAGTVRWSNALLGYTGRLRGFGSQDGLKEGEATYNPPSIASGVELTTTLAVTGAALGDYVQGVSFSLDTQGVKLSGRVSAADTVTVTLRNDTGSTVDLASGTLRAVVMTRQ